MSKLFGHSERTAPAVEGRRAGSATPPAGSLRAAKLGRAPVAIINGAGPAGATMATALAERGWEVFAFEKRSAPSPDEGDPRGYAFTLTGLGLNALPYSIRAGIEAKCHVLTHRTFVAPDRARRSSPYGDKKDDVLKAVRRLHFQDVALAAATAAGAKVAFDAKVIDVTPAGRATVLKDGLPETHEADLIVAADGAFSTTRSRIAALTGGSYSVQFDGVRFASLVLTAEEVDQLTLASRGLHFFSSVGGTDVLIPTPPVSTLLIVSKFIPQEGKLTPASAQELASTRNAEVQRVVSDLAERLVGAPVGHFVSTEMTTPYAGKCVVVGDAWNAIPAYAGQGVNSALQDVKALLDALDATDDLPAALEAYTHTRRAARKAIARLNTSIGNALMTGRYGSGFFGVREKLRAMVGVRSTYQKLVFDGELTK